ncbi:zinc finger MYM-type protein 1-like [Aphis gossypii]|uniref:zinc finger MYM-type protein 1-like n=1 Tax=Aphis gossypii TaxID=80765 RepID=UPI002158B7A9|nr:zinc finger MYM-type protein 1-like [Aphis gossypii]
MKQRSVILERIDQQLVHQMEFENNYWKNILKRVVAVVKALSSRGLSFRGDTNQIGCSNNVNFLMAIELIAEFDVVLSEHIKKYGNPGKGNTSYLSFHTYEQFILLMAEDVVNNIIQEVNKARYFSISIDSTPEISHTDQLSFIIRYVNEHGQPVERFLCFINNIGHKSQEMMEAVIHIFKKYNLNTNYLRGQSYDNASNMSGIYTGLQARIKSINSLADFVPCSAHSLNLVGKNAASCCHDANEFFRLLQNLYSFSTITTRRWKILNVSLKSLSETRWSARDDACKSLNKNWCLVLRALTTISEDKSVNVSTCCEAKGILKSIKTLKTSFMSIFWGDILERFNSCSKKLQSIQIDLGIVVEIYQSLIGFVHDIRCDDMFNDYKARAIEKCGISSLNTKPNRKKKRKRFFDEGNSEENVIEDEFENFKVNTYFMILDQIKSDLEKRKIAYDNLTSKYNFFYHMSELTPAEVKKNSDSLQNIYKNDLGSSFSIECVHFQSHIKV